MLKCGMAGGWPGEHNLRPRICGRTRRVCFKKIKKKKPVVVVDTAGIGLAR